MLVAGHPIAVSSPYNLSLPVVPPELTDAKKVQGEWEVGTCCQALGWEPTLGLLWGLFADLQTHQMEPWGWGRDDGGKADKNLIWVWHFPMALH